MPWHQFLDEAAAAGYTAVELGPFGYLPTHPEQLRDELGRRGLALTGATAGTALHRGGDALGAALVECRQVAALLAAMDAPYLITLPAMYTDLYTGALLEPAELTPDQWTTLGRGHSELGRVLQDEYDVRQMFHPHADAHVDNDVRNHPLPGTHRPRHRLPLPRHRAHRLRRRQQPGHRGRPPGPDRVRPPQIDRP